jgi:hypothetical protein
LKTAPSRSNSSIPAYRHSPSPSAEPLRQQLDCFQNNPLAQLQNGRKNSPLLAADGVLLRIRITPSAMRS